MNNRTLHTNALSYHSYDTKKIVSETNTRPYIQTHTIDRMVFQ